VALAKSQPGKLFYGTPGIPYQLAVEAMNAALGIKMTHVPFKGGPGVMEALIGNQINMSFDPVSTMTPQIKAGKVKGLAVTTKKRSAAAPDLPTVSETVLPGFEASSWQGVVAPAGTPEPIIRKLNAAIVRILNTDEARKQFEAQGVEASPTTPEEFGAYIAGELARWKKTAESAGIKAE
jgi:tripartite-type tricarboxylate transporter receptor subunit TctC